MAFDKNTPEQYNFKLQQQQQNLPKFGFDSVSQRQVTTKIPRKPENQFQTLIEKTSVAILVIQEEKICYANPIAELTMGYSRSQLFINSDFYHQLNPKGYKPDNLEQNYSKELKIKVQGDRECWLKCWWETIEWEYQPAIMITAFDVTKYKQKEAKTQQALTIEKERCQNKARFVSMVSHEFRTPLNIISFSTSLLKRHLNQWNEAKQLKYLNRLQTAVEHLSHLMDEVLIIGRAEAGKLKFNPQLLNLNSFCHNLLAEINLSQPNHQKVNFVNLANRESILADKNLLKLVLVNLLGNAIKYSPADSTIKFSVWWEKKQIVFEIADCGIGISPDEQPKIFEPFHRSNNVGDLPGHGLGLAIAKKLVELQGGQISLESQVDLGSTFVVKIPLKSPQILVSRE
ncbi:MAG TPA: HAMP domain-containing sensor histidine kinase [Coleofasciculaceae cyanobacterium]|jgi:K+-sensing histidine kinase KdpD